MSEVDLSEFIYRQFCEDCSSITGTNVIIIIINTVSVMFDNYDWRMMLKLLGVSSYRRRIKADRRLKGGAKTMYVLDG